MTAPSLLMEDPATAAASAASVEVEATEAEPVELSQDTVLLRLQPVVRSPVRSVRTCPDSSAGETTGPGLR